MRPAPAASAILALAFLAAFPAAAAAQAKSAQEILAASDAIRNPGQPFGLTVTLAEFRSGAPGQTMALKVYSKEEVGSGQYRSLLQFVEPQRDQGKLMMKTGNVLWFHDPGAGSTIRISPQQRLLGQASNGDVVTVNLAKDYAATLAGEESVTDADRQKRDCWKLELKATSDSVTYWRVEYWVDKATSRPVKGRFYSETDRLLKTAFYRSYEAQLGVERPTETIIIDGIDTALVTRMKFSAYAYRDVPESWFQKDSLGRFRPE